MRKGNKLSILFGHKILNNYIKKSHCTSLEIIFYFHLNKILESFFLFFWLKKYKPI